MRRADRERRCTSAPQASRTGAMTALFMSVIESPTRYVTGGVGGVGGGDGGSGCRGGSVRSSTTGAGSVVVRVHASAACALAGGAVALGTSVGSVVSVPVVSVPVVAGPVGAATAGAGADTATASVAAATVRITRRRQPATVRPGVR